MQNQQFSPVALLSVLLAGGLAMRSLPEPFGWLQTLTGVTLLVVLLAFDTENQRTVFQSVAFGTVCGFCCMLVVSGFLAHWATQPGSLQIAVPGGWLSVAWGAGALLFFFIDLMRVGSRAPGQAKQVIGTPAQFGMAPVAAAPTPAPAPISPEPVRQPLPIQPMREPEPSFAPVTQEPVQPQGEAAIPVAAVPPAPAPAGPPPKQALIYVNLLGEGLNMMRAVATQELGRGYYLITEPMPEGEQWEFQTGQVVRCEKKKLASGKHLVAVAEAQRA